jgi:hypothetical protein
VHARQAVVFGAAACVKNLRVNPLAIASHPQSKVPLVIVDFHLYTFRLCVAEAPCFQIFGPGDGSAFTPGEAFVGRAVFEAGFLTR